MYNCKVVVHPRGKLYLFSLEEEPRANDHFVDKGTLDLILFYHLHKGCLKCIEGTYDTKQFELFPIFRVKLLSSSGGLFDAWKSPIFHYFRYTPGRAQWKISSVQVKNGT